jgi:hypothetical protein
MHFSTHIQNIAMSMIDALVGSKTKLVSTLEENLHTARELLKVDSFDYWIDQIAGTELTEIPTTNYGVEQARRIWDPAPDTRSSLKSALISTCEAILTYCAEDDMCEAQGDYHYYVHTPTGAVFKESDFGFSPNRPAETITQTDTRIARTSELKVAHHELYNRC